jgi:predicted nucleotidyltransferase
MHNQTVRSKRQVLSRVRDHRDAIRALGVRRLALFGSFARNEPGRDSDVDILVEFEPGQKTFDHFMRLAFLLEDLLGRPVELVTTESLSPYLRPHIMEEVEDVPITA